MRVFVLLSLLLCAAPLPAQDWDWDAGNLDGFFLGPKTRFHDPDRVRFAPDGSVQRSLAVDGPTDFGLFTLLPDGRLCLDYSDGSSRCGVYVRDGKMRMLVTEGGKRLPFRFELGLGN